MAYREHHLWISGLSLAVVWGLYFWRLAELILAGGLLDTGFAGQMGIAFVLAIAVTVAVEIVLGLIEIVLTRKVQRRPRDQREILAGLQASHIALMVLLGLIFCLGSVAYFSGLSDLASNGVKSWTTTGNAMVLLGNILMAAFILTELVRYGFNIYLLRRAR